MTDEEAQRGMWRAFWENAIDRLRSQYDAAVAALQMETNRVTDKRIELEKARPATLVDPDEEDHYYDVYTDLDQLLTEIDGAGRLLRENTALNVYHLWESHTAVWSGWTARYHHGSVIGKLKRDGFLIDPLMQTLNKIVAVIKHGSKELWKQDKSFFAKPSPQMIYAANYIPPLSLSAEHIDAIFESARRSGPPGHAILVM